MSVTVATYTAGFDAMMEDMVTAKADPASTVEIRHDANVMASLLTMSRTDLANLLAIAMERLA